MKTNNVTSVDATTCDVTLQSPHTHTYNTMRLPVSYLRLEQFFLGINAQVIQEQFPDLSDDQREFLMTGYTPEDWAAMFPPEEEDVPVTDDETEAAAERYHGP